MHDVLNPAKMTAALVYAGIGLLVFFVSFVIFDKATPQYHLWDEVIHKQNKALAIVIGAVSIAMSIVIAAAIVG